MNASRHSATAWRPVPATDGGARADHAAEPSGVAYDNASFSAGLAALRAFAAIGVVVFHVFLFVPLDEIQEPHVEYWDPSDPSLFAQHLFLALFNGRGLVTLFFVLSGCVLAMSLRNRTSFGLAEMPGYLMRRGLRLYPLLIVAASAGALLQLAIGTQDLLSASHWANWHYAIGEEDLAWEWFKNAIGQSNTLNSPAWSIRVELIASALFPVLFYLSLEPLRATLTLLALVLAMFLVPGSLGDMHVFAFSFFIGALVPRYGQAAVRRFGAHKLIIRRVALVSIILIFMFARRSIDPTSLDAAPVVLVESLCSGAIVALTLYRPPPRLFLHPAIQWLGQVSYGIYLLHLIVLFALGHAFMPVTPWESHAQAGIALVGLTLATTAVTIVLAWMSYELLEDPLQRLGRTIDRRLCKIMARLI